MGIREIARTFYHSRAKVGRILTEPEPTPYSAEPPHCPKLGGFHEVIDQILAGDLEAPSKRRSSEGRGHKGLAVKLTDLR